MEVKDIDLVKNINSFAVVQLRPGTETKLLRVLLENGYSNVSFTNATGEMVKMIGGSHEDEESDRGEKSIDNSDGRSEGDDDSRVESEELKAEEDVDVDVEVEDDGTDLDGHESIKNENEENEMIKEKEKEFLESFYSRNSIDTPPKSMDDDEQRKFWEQIKEQHQQILKLDPSSPFEFSSLTLPTVLWGANALNSDQGPPPKFPPPAGFAYNPFLSTAINPFLPYLPSAAAGGPAGPHSDPSILNALKSPGDLPYPFAPGTTTEALAAALWSRHHANHSSQLLDTPPATPRAGGPGGPSPTDQHCLITGAKLRQRGRQLRRHERESSAYASCRLCRNRILANRLSNLHNHVRRHAVLKQFHCCYCSYAHTEVAKVRLHMLHNHKDDRSQPLDKRNDDMEAAWSMLMRECFPGYA